MNLPVEAPDEWMLEPELMMVNVGARLAVPVQVWDEALKAEIAPAVYDLSRRRALAVEGSSDQATGRSHEEIDRAVNEAALHPAWLARAHIPPSSPLTTR